MRFDERQRKAIAAGIACACEESAIIVHACAIGHDHVHAVVERHEKTIEQIVTHFKGRATKRMTADGCHPLARFNNPTPWAGGCWSVFVNDEAQLRSAIAYVERHPAKEGLAPQQWPFIRPV